MLWLLEAATYLLSLAYLWEMVDVLAGRVPRRSAPPAPRHPDGQRPFASLHVPAHNEPPEMVIATLRSLLALNYSAYEIVMVDDNTTNPALWHPVADFCAQHPDLIHFHHLAGLTRLQVRGAELCADRHRPARHRDRRRGRRLPGRG